MTGCEEAKNIRKKILQTNKIEIINTPIFFIQSQDLNADKKLTSLNF